MAGKKKGAGDGSLTTAILVQIRDEMRSMRADLSRLEARQSEDAIRLSTELVAVAHAVLEVRDILRDQRVSGTRLDDIEARLSRVEKKIA